MLVEPTWAAKFGAAQAKLNAGVEAGNVIEVVKRAAVLKRDREPNLRGWADVWAAH